VRGARLWPTQHWGDYMRGDDGTDRFPLLRRRGNVALIGLSTVLTTPPFLATGRLGAAQLSSLAQILDQTAASFRVVLIHHPPLSPRRRHLRRLTDAADFRSVLAAHGAELLLHGHDHRHAVVWLDGERQKIPAVGVPSASARVRHGGEDTAGYSLFRIDGDPGQWRCELIARQRGTDGALRDVERLNLHE
jgi:3',5'-cyclic AMP phosphodiesterase CpdA